MKSGAEDREWRQSGEVEVVDVSLEGLKWKDWTKEADMDVLEWRYRHERINMKRMPWRYRHEGAGMKGVSLEGLK